MIEISNSIKDQYLSGYICDKFKQTFKLNLENGQLVCINIPYNIFE
jgi:hypothetical protein